MTLARTWGVGLVGLVGQLVTVEADLSAGLPGTAVIGLPDPAIIQSRDRIRAAVLNSGHKWPDRRITLALHQVIEDQHLAEDRGHFSSCQRRPGFEDTLWT